LGQQQQSDVSHGGRATKESDVGRERRLETWFSLLAFQTLNQGSLFTANVSTSSSVEVDVKVIARAACVFTNETSFISFSNGLLQVGSLLVELSTDVDVSSGSVHGTASDETSFNQFVGVSSENFTIFACTRFTLVSIDDQITGTRVFLPTRLVHETPFETTGETGTTTAT